MAAFAVQRVTPSRSRQISAAPRRACRGCTSLVHLGRNSRLYLGHISRPSVAPGSHSHDGRVRARSLPNLHRRHRPPRRRGRRLISADLADLGRSRRPLAARTARRPSPLPLPPGTATPSDAPPALLILPTMRMRGAPSAQRSDLCLPGNSRRRGSTSQISSHRINYSTALLALQCVYPWSHGPCHNPPSQSDAPPASWRPGHA